MGNSGENIANDNSLVICPTLLYEILKETIKDNSLKKKNSNRIALEKLYLKKHHLVCRDLCTMLKYEMENKTSYNENIIANVDCDHIKNVCTNISKSDIENQRDFIKKSTATAISIALNENLFSIFHEKSKGDKITLADITSEKINEYVKYICNVKRIPIVIMDENWVSYFYYRYILSFAIKIHDIYPQSIIENIHKIVNNSIAPPKNHSNYNEYMEKTIGIINRMDIKDENFYTKMTHHFLDYVYLIYASVAKGIKTKDKNVKIIAEYWGISTN